MITIADIKPVNRPPYKEIICSGAERVDREAPVLQFYNVTLHSDDGTNSSFDAEVRASPNSYQIDWDEDLDEFLFRSIPSKEAERMKAEISSRIMALEKNTETVSRSRAAHQGQSSGPNEVSEGAKQRAERLSFPVSPIGHIRCLFLG